MKVSIFTTYTEPEKRRDPWEESLSCYRDYADEIIVTGKDWPFEFKWDLIGKTFQQGLDESTGDWAIRMDIDYLFHEKHIDVLRPLLKKFESFPAVVFPQYQFFTPDRFQMKTRLCIALNKRRFPNIKLNGGGDLCLATLNNKLLPVNKLPNLYIPVYQYESMFRTKEIIASDRARFARAWKSYFNSYGTRGGSTEEEAFKAWFNEIEKKYHTHTNKIKINDHPKYIIEKLRNLDDSQFGFSAFGLKAKSKFALKNFLKGKKELLLDGRINNLNLNSKIFE